jgi:hypothetical protein
VTDVFPFIVGSGRSGTTLLRALLDAHPQLAIPPESYFIVTLARRADRYETEGGFDAAMFCDDVAGHQRFARWGLPEQAMRDAVAAAAPADFPAAIRAVFGAYAAQQNKPRYADKTPKYVKDMARLTDLFPEARFVHIVRDGRDVVLSFQSLTWGPDAAIEAALRWRNWVELGQAVGNELGQDKYMEVRYEELVADAPAVLQDVCSFLSLDYSDQMLSYTEHADQIIEANYFPEGHSRIRMPPTKGLRDWRTEMSQEDLVKFELVAGDLLGRLGYERAVPDATAKRRRESDDEQVEGAPETAEIELDPELAVVIDEMNFLRKRVRRLSKRSRKFARQRDRNTRRLTGELRRANKRHARQLEKAERRRKTAVRRRKKVERTLQGLEETRWWRFRLRMKRITRPFTSFRARQKLR